MFIGLIFNSLISLMSMGNLKEKFLKWKKAFESKGRKVNLKKTKVMVSGSKGEVLKSKVDPCAKCAKRVHSFARMSSCSVCMSFVILGHHDG